MTPRMSMKTKHSTRPKLCTELVKAKLALMTTRSSTPLRRTQLLFLKRVSFHYANTHKHSLDSAIAKETGGDYERLLIGCTKTKYEYFADRFKESLHHIGRDDKFIEFAFSVLTPNELHHVDKAFQERQGKDLGSVIKADTSGHFEELLVLLLERHTHHNY